METNLDRMRKLLGADENTFVFPTPDRAEVERRAQVKLASKEWSYTLSHDSEMSGGWVHDIYPSLTAASARLGEVLRAQLGADGRVIYRTKGTDEEWRVSRKYSLLEYRRIMRWVA